MQQQSSLRSEASDQFERTEHGACYNNCKNNFIATLVRWVCCIPCTSISSCLRDCKDACCNCCINCCGEDDSSPVAENS